MSISVRTAVMSVNPNSNQAQNGRVYRDTDVMEPVNYSVEFSAEGGKEPKQLEMLWDNCAENGTPVDITFSQKKGRYGQVFVIYDIVVPKNASATVPVAKDIKA